ncbi:LysR substrate-binding domain-containing protein [Streptomyces sp. NPDC059637]|uniref:LysR substrate-binding domain-containing protein n=1 Tax=Streptomyces sp. NPDC059637 TaxID=3347752 RepID=UPI0036B22DC2
MAVVACCAAARSRRALAASSAVREWSTTTASAPRARFARTRPDGQRRRLRLGATHGPLLGALVDRLADAAPGTTVSTCASWSERELAELLAEGRLDYVLTGTCGSAPPPQCPHVLWEEIAVDPVCVMLADGHRLARGREVDLAALADEEWACVPGDGCFADCFTAACARSGFTPRGTGASCGPCSTS